MLKVESAKLNRDDCPHIPQRRGQVYSLIFAAMSGVPFVPLPYAGKVFDFAEATGAPTLRGVTRSMPVRLAEIDRLWDEHAERLPQLRERVRELQQRARTTCHRCGEFLDALPPARAAPSPSRATGREQEPDTTPALTR